MGWVCVKPMILFRNGEHIQLKGENEPVPEMETHRLRGALQRMRCIKYIDDAVPPLPVFQKSDFDSRNKKHRGRENR